LARKPQRGEIWWARTPNQPDDPHQPRPVLIVSDDTRNNDPDIDEVIVVPLFGSGRPGYTRVLLRQGQGGARKDSVIYCEEIVCLDIDFLDGGPFGGPVDEDILDAVIIGVRRALGEPAGLE